MTEDNQADASKPRPNKFFRLLRLWFAVGAAFILLKILQVPDVPAAIGAFALIAVLLFARGNLKL